MSRNRLPSKLLSALCVFALLLTLLPPPAIAAAPLTINPADPGKELNMVRMTNRSNMPPQYQSSEYHYTTDSIILEGKKVATGINSDADAWDFTLYINHMFNQFYLGDPTYKFALTFPRITHEIARGEEKAVLLYNTGDPQTPEEAAQAQQERQQSTLSLIQKIADLPKAEAMAEMEVVEVPYPQTAYMADFTITGNGYMTGDSMDGTIQTPSGAETAEKDEPMYAGTLIYNVSLTIDDMGYARATINFTDALGFGHSWVVEGFLGTAQPQKPPKPPKPKKPPEYNFDIPPEWEFIPPEDYDDTFVPPEDYLPPKNPLDELAPLDGYDPRTRDADPPKDPNNYDDLRPIDP